MRFAAGVEYCGTAYAGWQKQLHAASVQEQVEQALSVIADTPIQTVCAGRTDAGVHACGQVIHFDSPNPRSTRSWCLGTNTHLPSDISLRWVQPVDAEFSARFTAQARRYRYLILDGSTRSGLLGGRVTWHRYALDHQRMHNAAQTLVGEHDFSSFRASECQSRSPVREIFDISVTRSGRLIVIEVEANAFVHHMVRNIAGVLMAIGAGRKSSAWVKELLNIRDRRRGGVTAPPDGLYLIAVRYPDSLGLPVPEQAVLPVI